MLWWRLQARWAKNALENYAFRWAACHCGGSFVLLMSLRADVNSQLSPRAVNQLPCPTCPDMPRPAPWLPPRAACATRCRTATWRTKLMRLISLSSRIWSRRRLSGWMPTR